MEFSQYSRNSEIFVNLEFSQYSRNSDKKKKKKRLLSSKAKDFKNYINELKINVGGPDVAVYMI